MNKKVIIATIAILVSIGAWYVWQGQDFLVKDIEEGKVSFDNWKVYKNEDKNYQVKYPDYWQVVESGTDVSRVQFRNPIALVAFIEDSENSATFYSGATTARGGFSCAKEINKESIKVAGLNAIKKIWIFEQSPSIDGCEWAGEAILVEFSNGQNEGYLHYSFEFHIVDGNNSLVDQVLSSFELIK